MKFNCISGLPRSGSTLLCNILNQNPKFHASSTSVICQVTGVVSNALSHSPEIKSELAHDKLGTEVRLVDAMRAYIGSWYKGKEVVFDKSRGWSSNHLVFNQLFPNGKMIVMVRDLRGVFASVEKQHRKFPMLDDAGNPLQKTIYTKADEMFSPNGIIGMPIIGVEDVLRRVPKYCLIVRYEDLAGFPEKTMKNIYEFIGEEPFEHDFNRIKNTATDLDSLYLNKFPHEGQGKVKPSNGEWKAYVPTDVAELIMSKFEGYNKAFGYEVS